MTSSVLLAVSPFLPCNSPAGLSDMPTNYKVISRTTNVMKVKNKQLEINSDTGKIQMNTQLHHILINVIVFIFNKYYNMCPQVRFQAEKYRSAIKEHRRKTNVLLQSGLFNIIMQGALPLTTN